MKTALVGSSGYIASFIIDRLSKLSEIDLVVKIDQNKEADVYLDLKRPDLFDYSILNDLDIIIFTAAISGPDKCANEFDDCWAINVTGTVYFIKKALARKCRVLFFSSDAVFGGDLGVVYSEESKTNAVTPYGKMKKAVEDEFVNESLFKAIRLSYVASAKDKFVSYCINCIKSDVIADIFHPFYRNVIVVSDVVDVVEFFICKWDLFKEKYLNIAGNELVSRIRIADELNRICGGKLRYTISKPEEDFFKNRPSITQMKSLYIQRYNIISNSSFSEKFLKELEDTEI